MRFVSRSAEGSLHRRYVRPGSHVTHDANLLPERINAVVSGGDEVLGRFPATSGCFHRCSPPPHHHLHLLYVVKPAAGRNLPQEWTPGSGQRSRPSPASHSGHLHAGIKAAASVSTLPTPHPGFGLLQQVSMFQLCPCVSSDGRHGSHLVPPGRAAFQPPLSVIHLYIIRQGPAHKDSW